MAAQLSTRSFYSITLTFILLSVLGQVSTSIYTPFFRELATLYSTRIDPIEQSVATFLIAFSCSQLISGIVCDYVNKRRFLIVGLLVFTAGTAIILLASNEPWFTTGRVIQGLGGGVGVSVTRALSKQIFNPAQLNLSLSFTNMAFGIAPAISPIAGTLIGERFGVTAIFGAVLILSSVTFVLLVSSPIHKTRILVASTQEVFEQTIHLLRQFFLKICLVGLASGLLYGVVFCFVTLAPAIVLEQHNLNKTTFSLYSLFATLSFVLGSLTNARIVSLSTGKKFKSASAAIMLVSLFTAALAWLTGWDNLYLLMGFSYCVFFIIGIAMPCSVSMMLGFSHTSAGFLAALTGFFHLSGAAAGAYLAALVNMNPTQAFFLLTCGLSICSFVASRYIESDNKPDTARQT